MGCTLALSCSIPLRVRVPGLGVSRVGSVRSRVDRVRSERLPVRFACRLRGQGQNSACLKTRSGPNWLKLRS